MLVPYKDIPTFDCVTETWTVTNFQNQELFADYLDSLWSDECDYKFDKDSLFFNEMGRKFETKKYYTNFPRKSKERKEFWKFEGRKSNRGVIYKGKNREWFVPPPYYFGLNYCRIANKEKGGNDSFLDIRDIQYHLCLYEYRAAAHNLHAILTKKRQMASSLIHCMVLSNSYWFRRNSVNKVFASDSTYINTEDGIWKFFNKIRDFLNSHTDWYRNNLPNSEFSWQQRIEVTQNGRKAFKGRNSVLSGITLNQSPTKSVGGMSTFGYHEEAGIAPKLDVTYGYFRPAVESGIYTTGMFIAAGSVGDLKQCGPLKYYMYRPTENKFLATTSTWVDEKRIPTKVGLFIPEHWGMPGFMDEFGNSQVEAAYKFLQKKYEEMKKNPKISAKDYQLELSQHPIFLDDAFRHRGVSYYPADLIAVQQERINLKERENLWDFKPQKGLLEEDAEGKVVLKPTKSEEHQYPIKPEWEDKRGCVTIYEPPMENAEWFTYFGGADTVEADTSKTSESVFAIDIFKTAVEVVYEENGVRKTKIEGDKLVATYRGRFDDNEKTNEQAWLLIKMYNAFTLAERSKPSFVKYMQRKGRAEKYLAKESDIPIFKDLNQSTISSKSPFGFIIRPNQPNDSMLKFIKDYIKEYLLSGYGSIYKESGEELRELRGIDRIDDYWLLEELLQYNDDSGNYDRHISFGAALMLAKIFQQNRVIKRVNTIQNKKPKQPLPPKTYNMLSGGTRIRKKQKTLL